MSALQFILASLRHFRRIHIAVGLGVAVATAVLTGALLVGDSVRGSLRDLTLARLGRIDEALVGPLFRESLADELAASQLVKRHYSDVEPLLLLAGTLQTGSGDSLRRATQATVIGCRESFWSLGRGDPVKSLGDGEVAISDTLASELNANVGDHVMLRVPALEALPTESLLGETEDTTRSRRYRIAAVLPPEGIARFGLQSTQHLPRNVFLPLASMQSLLDQPGKANVLLVASKGMGAPPGEEAIAVLQAELRPQLEDYGLKVEVVESPVRYVRISSSQLVLSDAVVAAAHKAFAGKTVQPVVTYLANSISAGEGESRRQFPYSTISGVDSIAGIGPLPDNAGQPIVLAADEIALNRWAADDLNVAVDDRITVKFYEPESIHGMLLEHEPPATFILKAIVELQSGTGEPTSARDPKFTPDMPGVTDSETINDWDVPFELVEPRRPKDDAYWDEFRTTPKAFVSLEAGERLWASRWGAISLLRIPVEGPAGADEFASRLRNAIDPADVGLTFQPIKRLGLSAASGTTPFDGLFLGFSFFLMASAVMLIALLFQLGVAGRAHELGTLSALGITGTRAARMLASEGLIVAMLGAVVGVIAGVGYAWLMIYGLRTWWVAAVATPFLELHVTPKSLVIGWAVGVFMAWLTICVAIRNLVRTPAARLLAGQLESRGGRGQGTGSKSGTQFRSWNWAAFRTVLILAVAAFIVMGFFLKDEARAGVFFGSGTAVLILLLGEARHQLRSRRSEDSRNQLTLAGLSALNTARHPGRSALTIGLVASASFLIIAMSAFRLETGDAGTGGFELMATSDQSILRDLNSSEGRFELGFKDAESNALAQWRIYSLRMKSGEDASCLNLYKPSQPVVLGVPSAMIIRGQFAWASVDANLPVKESEFNPSPWKYLDAMLGDDSYGRRIIPVIIDANTATYSLKVGLGDRFTIPDEIDRAMTLQVVALLKNSVLQGKLMVSEASFKSLYPDTPGYRFFFAERTDPANRDDGFDAVAAARVLESTLVAEGFDATNARDQLSQFLAVQNTYLSTFQSLGALGLLLGTIGLAVVQLRSVLERRGELALMRASGFRRGRLVGMVLWENAVLLVGGLAIGAIAAGVALLPQWGPQSAGVPWRTLAALLGTIALVGLVAGWLATRSALRAPIVPALRGE